MKTVSIIIPCYLQQEYLPEAIQSALDQTVKPKEIICVIDGATDNSLAIAERFAKENPVIKVIHQANKGLASARNTGIMNATGDYIIPLDSDDILMEKYVEEVLKRIEETDADIVAPSFKAFGKNNGLTILGENLTLEHFLTGGNYIGYFSAIKRSALLEVGGYNPKMKWGYEDYDLTIDLLKRGKTISVIKEPLVLYRTKEHSMINEANDHRKELLDQMKLNHPNLTWKI